MSQPQGDRMYQSFELSATPRKERFDHFASLVDELFCPMECRLSDGDSTSFDARISTASLGSVQLAEVSTSPLDVRRNRRHIAHICDAPYLIKFQLEGQSQLSQAGVDVHLRPGDFAICSTAEPYRLRFEGAYKMPVLAVPDNVMRSLTPDPNRFLGKRMPGSDACCGLLSSFVGQVVSKMAELPAQMADRVQTNILDLLGGVLSAHGGGGEDRPPTDQHIRRIKSFIAEHLCDRQLGPAMIAASMGVSTRYLHMIFASESLTLTRYIRALRIAACRRSLIDPACRTMTVTDIAFRWGFYDLSHMTRSFREAFGTTPTDFRRKSLQR